MLNYSVCIYIYTDAVRFLVGVQNSTARRIGRLRFVQIAADNVLDTHGGLVKRSDRFGVGRFHQCRSVPEQANYA